MEIRSTFSETCDSATCSPQAPCVLPCDAHRTNASRYHVVFRNSVDANNDNIALLVYQVFLRI